MQFLKRKLGVTTLARMTTVGALGGVTLLTGRWGLQDNGLHGAILGCYTGLHWAALDCNGQYLDVIGCS